MDSKRRKFQFHPEFTRKRFGICSGEASAQSLRATDSSCADLCDAHEPRPQATTTREMELPALSKEHNMHCGTVRGTTVPSSVAAECRSYALSAEMSISES